MQYYCMIIIIKIIITIIIIKIIITIIIIKTIITISIELYKMVIAVAE